MSRPELRNRLDVLTSLDGKEYSYLGLHSPASRDRTPLCRGLCAARDRRELLQASGDAAVIPEGFRKRRGVCLYAERVAKWRNSMPWLGCVRRD
ncbi:hypothetical protein E2C01_096330 [Portunus trituberculatus]|uniref:Uncharacterized protein n=1 Tax=Portunus trituberculatus TaxID=210409 RepID=A0A5B7K6L4_PORTR|nr:hypothetical protein [Portunus trituberculatus]